MVVDRRHSEIYGRQREIYEEQNTQDTIVKSRTSQERKTKQPDPT
jgi:hypothetical protein